MTAQDMADLHAACFVTPRPWQAQEFARLLALQTTIKSTDEFGKFGFALAQLSGTNSSELLTLAVAPHQRRKGIARHLLGALMQTAKTHGATHMMLEVAQDNTAAIALYAKFGFVQIGKRAKYYRTPDGDRLDALLLRCGF